MTLELVLVTPVLLLLLFLLVFAGRVVEARGDVRSAAGAAARAASQERTEAAARAAADRAATDSLADRRVGCRDGLDVTFDLIGDGRFQPGNYVVVTVDCDVDVSDLVGLGVPGSLGQDAAASELIDEHRRAGS